MAIFKQPALTIDQQIELLQKKGLIIDNIALATEWLSQVSYFRFKKYTYKYKDYTDGKPGDFHPNTNFSQVISLYQFDRKLKSLLFQFLEVIEVAIKTKISNSMSCKFGSHWYLDKNNFGPGFDFSGFISELTEKCDKSAETFVTSYKQVYHDPPTPPSWVIMELLTFGTISMIFEHLYAREEKVAICREFKLPESILISWMHSFSYIRNKCAHHSRIVYQRVKTQPKMPSRSKHIFLKEIDLIDFDSIYCSLCCMQFLVKQIDPSITYEKDLKYLVDNSPEIDFPILGFTPKWTEETIWQ